MDGNITNTNLDVPILMDILSDGGAYKGMVCNSTVNINY